MHELLLLAKLNYKILLFSIGLMLFSPRVLCAAGRKPKTQHSISEGSPDLGIKKKPREGKGTFFHLSFHLNYAICMYCICHRKNTDLGKFGGLVCIDFIRVLILFIVFEFV